MPSVTRRWRGDERGAAMMMTIMVLLVLLTLGAGALLSSSLDLKAANSDHTGHQAFFLAEAGVQEALSRMNRIGVIDFQADIVNRWNSVWGDTSIKSMPGYSTMRYSPVVVADPASPANRGTITSTGLGDSKSRRVIRVSIQRGPLSGSPGAVYAASDDVHTDFSGNAFLVDGNDHDLNLNRILNGDVRPGVSTRNDNVTNEVVGSLSDQQKDNVQGLGFSLNPLTPSVMTTGGPSNSDLAQIISDLLARPGVVKWNSSNINGGDKAGSCPPGGPMTPQITHFTASSVTQNGTASGCGIAVIDGDLKINGTFDFTGWIIVRGKTTIHTNASNDGTIVTGNATLIGSLWTGSFDIEIGGSAIIAYSNQAMQIADGTGGGGSTPRPMMITSWYEVY
jgi:hypothetical protein